MTEKNKLPFSRQEYWTLLEAIEIADWVLFSHKTEIPKSQKHYQSLFQKIYSYAKSYGFEEMVEFVEDENEYFPTKRFEETSNSQEIIEEFENESFWEELVHRLVEREINRLRKSGKIKKEVSIEEYFEASNPIEEIFASEFEKNGLENLVLKDPK